MDQDIASQRHVAGTYLFLDMVPFPGGAFWIIMRPLRKIEPLPGRVDMIHEHPRYGGHMAVPRPFGPVRMTVVTGSVQQSGDLRRRRIRGHQIVASRNRRICQRRICQLQQCRRSNNCGRDPTDAFFQRLVRVVLPDSKHSCL